MGSGPTPDYTAAANDVALFRRAPSGEGELDRVLLRVTGRAPWQMLSGVLTGKSPAGPRARAAGGSTGRATYHAVLTPKGKMVADLWAVRTAGGNGGGPVPAGAEVILLDVPATAATGLRDHLAKYLPPRFAAISDTSDELGMFTLVGPASPSALKRQLRGIEDAAVAALDEGEWITPAGHEGASVVRTADVWPPAYTVIGELEATLGLQRRLLADGIVEGSADAWSTLRVEAGRPAYGPDMDERTIPVEAGIHDRAIDYRKGCYTGQEVIVRIRDRGRVNRHLRLLRLGEAPIPPGGTELTDPDTGKKAGWITSAVSSPRFGEAVALAYVRREATTVLVGASEVRVPVPTGAEEG